jgi:MFS family permease
MSALAILLLVRGATHSYAAAGVAVGAFALATAGCAPLVGRLIDRFGRARMLVPFALAQSGAYVGLVVATSAGAGVLVLVALAAVAGTLLPPIAPVVRVLLRQGFDDPALRDTAYALDAVAQETIWIAGPLVVAPVFSCQYALVGRSVAPGTETEAFTWISAALIGGLAAGSAVGGAVVGPLGISAPFVIACATSMVAALIAVSVRGVVRGSPSRAG